MWRVIGVVCLVTANAFAQPGATPQSTLVAPPKPERSDRFLIALDGLFGGNDRWFYGAWQAELEATILREPLRLRARLFGTLAGGTLESDWSGEFKRYGGGVEARWCAIEQLACLFGDLDIGYQKLTMDDEDAMFVRSDIGVVAGLRIGLDLGGAVRVRFALELYEVFADHKSAIGSQDGARSFHTVALSVALGYQL